MTQFILRQVTKQSQLYNKRQKPTQRMMGEIRPKVRKKVNERSDGYCEGCGRHKLNCWTLENAHIDGRGVIDHMTEDTDLLRLCGPSTQSGTCHHYVTVSREGRQYMQDQRERLLKGMKPIKISEWKPLREGA